MAGMRVAASGSCVASSLCHSTLRGWRRHDLQLVGRVVSAERQAGEGITAQAAGARNSLVRQEDDAARLQPLCAGHPSATAVLGGLVGQGAGALGRDVDDDVRAFNDLLLMLKDTHKGAGRVRYAADAS
jgi:hypothetical protein